MDIKDKEKLDEELHAIYKWANDEEDRIREELIKTGKHQVGLDTNTEHYKPVYEEMKRRIHEVGKKYGAI